MYWHSIKIQLRYMNALTVNKMQLKYEKVLTANKNAHKIWEAVGSR